MTEVTPVVIAMLCMLGQVTGLRNSCGVDSRPHVKGICGDALLRARENLCFILYTEYPEHFGRSMNKRSVTDIDQYPVHAFANMNLPARDAEKERSGTPATAENVRKLYVSLFPKVQTLLPEMDRSLLPQAPGSQQAKRGGELAQNVQKRGMVCDCCFNQCLPSVLARYC
uniref:Insulin-like 1A n=1 Tax=Charonia tritonis TaxID=1960912 RepID=A0A1S6JQ28_9CAEN|nr:insulin-like 1A precursor [Charonia tritonis]